MLGKTERTSSCRYKPRDRDDSKIHLLSEINSFIMAKFLMNTSDYLKKPNGNKTVTLIKKTKFESFNESILGLGEIKNKSQQRNALSVLFDLEGFTTFCKQIDPQLAVPEYLSEFLKWLFEQIRKELTVKKYPEGYDTFSELPFLAKYMGDGVLFLWDTEELSDTEIMNIIVSMFAICQNYKDDFYSKIAKKVVSPPERLRCGIARGAIYSVGDGSDFVGPCINVSARLQKLSSLTFSFSRRGLNPAVNTGFNKNTLTVKTDIRGIGSDELVCVRKMEYDKLSAEGRKIFREV